MSSRESKVEITISREILLSFVPLGGSYHKTVKGGQQFADNQVRGPACPGSQRPCCRPEIYRVTLDIFSSKNLRRAAFFRLYLVSLVDVWDTGTFNKCVWVVLMAVLIYLRLTRSQPRTVPHFLINCSCFTIAVVVVVVLY